MLKRVLVRAAIPRVCFHDLWHTFATMVLEHGMDVKTLPTIIGHISSANTLDIYGHVTDMVQKQDTVKINHKIGKTGALIHRRKRNSTPTRATSNLTNLSTVSGEQAVSTKSTIASRTKILPGRHRWKTDFPQCLCQDQRGMRR